MPLFPHSGTNEIGLDAMADRLYVFIKMQLMVYIAAGIYNATVGNAYGLLETYTGSNPLVLQAFGNVGIGTTDLKGTIFISITLVIMRLFV